MGSDPSPEQAPREVDVDNGKECQGTEHAFSTIFKCDKQNCEAFLCRKCIGYQSQSGQRYCICCAAKQEIDEGKFEGDSAMVDGAGKAIKMEKVLNVEKDNQALWQQFFDYIAKQDAIAAKQIEDAKRVQKEIDKRHKQAVASYTVSQTGDCEFLVTET